MRVIFIYAIAICSCLFNATANSVIIIEITTTDKSTSYAINKREMTLPEIGTWMKKVIEAFGDKDPVFVQPDACTTFATVYTLLELLKDSGLKDVSIEAECTQAKDFIIRRSLTIKPENLIKDEHVWPPRALEFKMN